MVPIIVGKFQLRTSIPIFGRVVSKYFPIQVQAFGDLVKPIMDSGKATI
jgi:hypothetical protein